jgi:hypothetical protein
MNESGSGRGPNWGLVMLVPLAVIVAKAAIHHRAIREPRWTRSAWAGGGYGHHVGFEAGDAAPGGRAGFRLPPKIEWMLDTWHTRAHQATDPTESPTI